jgi:hypothetical protein
MADHDRLGAGRLLCAVIRNEVEYIWRRHAADELLGRAVAIEDRTISLTA